MILPNKQELQQIEFNYSLDIEFQECRIWLVCFLLQNENTRRPGFYTVLVTRVSSNFPQLKQLNKIKNTCEYCDLLEL